MQKNILIITGSPRKNGNSAALAEAFRRGAEEKQHNVTFFHSVQSRLSGCLACDRCWSDDINACVISDDFRKLVSELLRADVVVFAYPLYWSVMPAQLKLAIDRLYAFCSPKCKQTLRGKQTVQLLCGECEGNEIFDTVRAIHAGLNSYLGWESVGEVAIPAVFEAGAIQKTDGLQRAYELGKAI